MKITEKGKDYVVVSEKNLFDDELIGLPRVHIIKLDFNNPTEEKIKKVISLYPKTNRFVIEDNIREYNSILRSTSKKYYILNGPTDNIITFFKRNNKVMFNFNCLYEDVYYVCTFNDIFRGILENAEVVAMNQELFEDKEHILEKWNGNVIITEEVYI